MGHADTGALAAWRLGNEPHCPANGDEVARFEAACVAWVRPGQISSSRLMHNDIYFDAGGRDENNRDD
jgi:hypothetical protein